ncbi:NAD(P)-dependent oxidoreductase [Geminocystis herdmanii]|uniref:NAD(P)-dependent oxidoreductase n=1 Tax=Geminocystis herdmanii TaxID=669359 RepID=UPI00034CFAFE|nr:NAD(P)-dependent oxidoreductase [Geminocystis herdmanii]
MDKKNIGFIGLGVMGSPMAQNLVKHQYNVKGWNRTQIDRAAPLCDRTLVTQALENGVKIVSTIEDAVKDADFVCICVSDVPDVNEVIFGEDGIVHFAKPETIIIDFSTIGTQAVKEINDKLRSNGLHFMDAPVSGGDIGAQNGTLTIMVGGDDRDFQTSLPIFQAMGKNIVHCGSIGNGQAVKLCNQVLASIHMMAICEAMELAKTLNIDPDLMIKVCSTGAAGSWALTNLAPKVASSDFAPGFMIKHILKDLRLVTESLENQTLPATDLATQMFQSVAELGGATQGTQAMIRAYQK